MSCKKFSLLGWFSQLFLPIFSVNKTQCQLSKRLAGPIIPLSWSGLEKGFNHGCSHQGAVNNHCLSLYWAIYGMVTTNEQNEQPCDPSASLLLTRENAVFCNNDIKIDK